MTQGASKKSPESIDTDEVLWSVSDEVFGFPESGSSPNTELDPLFLDLLSYPHPFKGFLPFTSSKTHSNREESESSRMEKFFAHAETDTATEWRDAKGFPHSMEYVGFPFNKIVKEGNVYDWTDLEAVLDQIASRGRQAVIRIILDNPGEAHGSWAPQFWFQKGVHFNRYPVEDHGGGWSPDYSSVFVRKDILEFVQRFGERLDGDPRVAFVMLGLIGFWGEWHTYPHTEWMPDGIFLGELVTAFQTAFKTTKCVCRQPEKYLLKAEMESEAGACKVGLHDDMFTSTTLGDTGWFMYPRMERAGVSECWRGEAFGGEVAPAWQASLFDPEEKRPKPSQSLSECVKATHASWMVTRAGEGRGINHFAFSRRKGYPEDKRVAAREGAVAMGYRFAFKGAFAKRTEEGVGFSFVIVNSGVAPVYYSVVAHLVVGVGAQGRWQVNSEGKLQFWSAKGEGGLKILLRAPVRSIGSPSTEAYDFRGLLPSPQPSGDWNANLVGELTGSLVSKLSQDQREELSTAAASAEAADRFGLFVGILLTSPHTLSNQLPFVFFSRGQTLPRHSPSSSKQTEAPFLLPVSSPDAATLLKCILSETHTGSLLK
uniref:DUF4832 domain-containing protein n=1 Tax=Chromera velia CCMP2878 TaxID=1169474 RepID=A0A0G4I8T9_9ALVE|eukprot:Cvel_11963.t1-p1 / transcript=Cvel_11963.t1 / gene=Cvel_11963 / organism=Chromera_velia_CCMP2878 / gene_product=hypothetical protein / transcript_product=hypothetical protein / location=Cvel_scaffold766:60021-63358(-) / protein_length=598 / sequence_SO=supercontig / SO=protein_coding / is_pseudo=false